MLLSLVLTMLPVTHARLLDNDEAAIALVDDPATTREQLQLEERHLLELRPSYGLAIGKMVGGTALLGAGLLVAYLDVAAAPLAILMFAYVGGPAGLAIAVGCAIVFGAAALLGMIVGGALIVNGARSIGTIREQRAEYDQRLSAVREELREVPAGVTLTRF